MEYGDGPVIALGVKSSERPPAYEVGRRREMRWPMVRCRTR